MKNLRSFSVLDFDVKGWLKTQLTLQAKGLSGHLDEIWPDIKESAWIGKEKEGWERLPYWLDGFIPLAYLLKDETMIQKAQYYIQSIIQFQQEDGWICPCKKEQRKEYDLWAVFLICKVFVIYYQCSHDEKIIDVVYKVLKNLYDLLVQQEIALKHWDRYRYFECFIAIEWLYDLKQEDWLLHLAKILDEQGIQYAQMLEALKETRLTWNLDTHGVNVAMALKQEVVTYRLLSLPYQDIAEQMWQILEKYHGTAVGTFTCDECLSERSPIQGSELCSIVELMFSFEILFEKTKDSKWLDRLEKVTFNALPATLSEDLWTHQYDQMVNQIQCTPFQNRSIFKTNGNEAHLFGLEPNYGCCTANFNQGWPKYALSCFKRCDEGIIQASLAPCDLKTTIQGVGVHIQVETQYPFSSEIRYQITTDKDVSFSFFIYLPSWCKTILYNDKPIPNQSFLEISQTWKKATKFTLKLIDTPHLKPYDDCLYTLEYGPLVFALPLQTRFERIEYIKDGVTRKFPYCDYYLYRESDYNYAFASQQFQIFTNLQTNNPFSFHHPGLRIQTQMQKIDWPYEKGFDSVCAKHPLSITPIDKVEIKQLFPYGCCKLRMTAMPLLQKTKKELQ